jgi:hypothetical protein
MSDTCKHKSVTIYYRIVAIASRYEPAEFIQFAECDECGKTGAPEDFPDSEITDEINAGDSLHGAPSEFYD